MFESTAAIYNGKIEDTGAKMLQLIHMYMNRNLIADCNIIGFKHTHTFVSHNCHLTHVYMNSNLFFDCIRIGFKNTQTFV